ncbi:MAG: hypothetical protein EBT03_10340 [Betaproteobacteria bacterium]|nr:hypothetical protein [Betaproteobacteria bacterium]NCA17333.1 hypothetical protein [Betaproteobacteria bacterium]
MKQDQVFLASILALNLPRELGHLVSPEQADEMEPEDGELLARALDLAEGVLSGFRRRKLDREDVANVTYAASEFTRRDYTKTWDGLIQAYLDLVAMHEVFRWVTIVRMAGREPSEVFAMMTEAAEEARSKANLNLN